MSTFSFGLRYWKKYIPFSVFYKIIGLVALLCDLSLPLLSAGMIDCVIAYDPSSPPDVSREFFSFLYTGRFGELGSARLFGNVLLFFCAFLLARILLIYVKNVSFQWCGLQMENKLREDTYDKLLELDGETISRYNVGDLLTAMNRDTIVFKELYSRMSTQLFDSVCVIVVSTLVLCSFDPLLLILPAVIVLPVSLILLSFLKRARALFRQIRQSYAELNLNVQENVNAVRIVRSFAAEETEIKKFDECNQKVRRLNDAQVKLSAKYNAIFTAFQQAGYVGTIALATFLVLNGNLYLGALTACATYVMKIISHVTQISRICFMMQNQLVSGGRLKTLLTEESGVPDYPSSLLPSQRPHIRMKDVCLTLGDKSVLKHIDLDIPFGKKIGVMGGTGSGKSVLLKCFSRIYEITSGEITLDGRDIREYSLESLRAEYAYVFQDVFLFSNTIDANIAFARPDCGEEEVIAAAESAQAARFIEKLEDGYQTVVGERGLGISGGQKQRVSIARALLKGAPVLVLDDASSALDMATEKKVLTSLKNLPEHSLLIAAHRVSSVMDCDEIIYLQDGEIVERGTAQELIALGGRFAAVYDLQTRDGQLDDSSYGKEEA